VLKLEPLTEPAFAEAASPGREYLNAKEKEGYGFRGYRLASGSDAEADKKWKLFSHFLISK
jgi:hypothetical protein